MKWGSRSSTKWADAPSASAILKKLRPNTDSAVCLPSLPGSGIAI